MKSINFIFLILITVCFKKTFAQNSWTQKTDFGGSARVGAVGFSIEGKGYIGRNDFWQYNPSTDTWVQKADVPGGSRQYAVSFSLVAKGMFVRGSGMEQIMGMRIRSFGSMTL